MLLTDSEALTQMEVAPVKTGSRLGSVGVESATIAGRQGRLRVGLVWKSAINSHFDADRTEIDRDSRSLDWSWAVRRFPCSASRSVHFDHESLAAERLLAVQ